MSKNHRNRRKQQTGLQNLGRIEFFNSIDPKQPLVTSDRNGTECPTAVPVAAVPVWDRVPDALRNHWAFCRVRRHRFFLANMQISTNSGQFRVILTATKNCGEPNVRRTFHRNNAGKQTGRPCGLLHPPHRLISPSVS